MPVSKRRPVAIYKNCVGIVAEYNPLHHGHRYHIRKAKEKSGADGVIVVLSSYFTQRGEPALLGKWDRAESALRAGANLVLELPVFFSCHNAGVFSSGAVDTLAATGLVRSLSFGMEEPDFDFEPLLHILVQEPVTFKDTLKKCLHSGFSYVSARARALSAMQPEWGRFVSMPNNSLALAYMERIARKRYDIRPFPVCRLGAGYHDSSLPRRGEEEVVFASASGVRRALLEGRREDAEEALPLSTAIILKRCMEQGAFVLSTELLWRMVRTLLLRTDPASLAASSEMTEGMENRLLRFVSESPSWESFVGRCITRRYPRGRIQRQLIHFLLGVGHDENRELQHKGPAYIHPLAADEQGVEMLRSMRKTATLPVVGKLPLSAKGSTRRLAELELSSAEIWENLTPAFGAGQERKRHLLTAQESAAEGNAP